MRAREVLLAYANNWHGADCAGNFSPFAECSCGLAEWVTKAEAEATAAAEQRLVRPCREDEAYAAGQLAGYEDGYDAGLRPSVEPAGRLAVAASILLRVSETMMPERAACGHDRRWLLSLLDDLREALPTQASDSKEPDPDVESCVRWAMTHYDQPLDGDLSAKDVLGLSAFIARHLSERIEAEASDSKETTT